MLRPLPPGLMVAVILPILLAACLPAVLDPRDPHPGLAVAGAEPPPQANPTVTADAPESAAPPAFPPMRVPAADAARHLADDPLAIRFVILRRLAEDNVIPTAEALGRMAANRGALLPLTEPQPPAAGLDRPLPPADAVIARARDLAGGQVRGSANSRSAEMAFLLESILPATPHLRQPLSPPDVVAARNLLDRLDRLEDAGLITYPEHREEKAAIEDLLTSGRLPQALAAIPPPAPPKRTAPHKPRPHRGATPEVIPDPPGVAAPKLNAGAKGPAGVHLLSMASATYGDKAWTTLKTQYPELAELTYKVVKADLGELGVTFRLIAGPLEPNAAERLCGALRGKGQACMPTPFPP